MDTFFRWVQERLVYHGYNPGKVDGIYGRNTRNAVVAFQRARGVRADGVLRDETVIRLRNGTSTPPIPVKTLAEEFPWMETALRKKGLHEGNDNKELREFLKSDGQTLGDPAKLPWCGDLVETCIGLVLPEEVLPTNPYLARNWGKFGAVVKPCYGAVLSFWRGKKNGTSGHVGFYYAEDETHYLVLGGNQKNRISVARLDKERLLASRLPLTGGPYRVIKRQVAASGDVSTNEA